MTDAEKLALITRITDIQVEHQDDEDGDKYLADPHLALEAISVVLSDGPRSNGALRQYLEVPS